MTTKDFINKIDCLDGLKQLEDNSVDSIVTDPPYGISFMNKKWDYNVPSINIWKECLRVLKPGGHILVACGTRTQHRMATSIEDAGFEIRDIIAWIYSTGFPKSLNIGKKIDEIQGNKREVIGKKPAGWHKTNIINDDGWKGESEDRLVNNSMGSSEWEGLGTALKPAMELWTLARKPLSEKTVAENVLKWGCGGINIDKCRIGTETLINEYCSKKEGYMSDKEGASGGKFSKDGGNIVNGRFPANVIHDGSDEVVKLFPESNNEGHWAKTKVTGYGEFGNGKAEYFGVGRKDKIDGSVARFFYTAKASASERSKGLYDFDGKYMDESREVGSLGGTNPRNRGAESLRKNFHPTVKPLDLMRYLVRLVTVKGGIVLDPFIGSGTTAIACKQEDFQYIGFEISKEYYNIAINRVKSYDREKKLDSFIKPEDYENE